MLVKYSFDFLFSGKGDVMVVFCGWGWMYACVSTVFDFKKWVLFDESDDR